MLEYQPMASSDNWRVERFRDLAIEFGLGSLGSEVSSLASGSSDARHQTLDERLAAQMALFHECGLAQPRAWSFVRQLYGINPLIIPDGSDPEDFMRRSRAEICAREGLHKTQLQMELDSLRGQWTEWSKQTEKDSPAQGPESAVQSPEPKVQGPKPGLAGTLDSGPGTLDPGDGAAILRECGFDDRMFEGVLVFDPTQDVQTNPNQTVERSPEKNRTERDWFINRCAESRAMFQEPGARATVREVLGTELQLLRLQDSMSTLTPGMANYEKMDKLKTSMWTRYEKQLEKLEKMFPDLGTSGRVSFRQVISTLIGGERDFYGDGNNKRRDALFTAGEIQVLTRKSVQNPQMQYRLSTSLLVMEAIHGLLDRKFRSELAKKPGLLRKIDALARAAMDVAHGEPTVDLENGVTPTEGDNFEEVVEFSTEPRP